MNKTTPILRFFASCPLRSFPSSLLWGLFFWVVSLSPADEIITITEAALPWNWAYPALQNDRIQGPQREHFRYYRCFSLYIACRCVYAMFRPIESAESVWVG